MSDGFPNEAVALRPKLVVVQDGINACPYVEGQSARMPLHVPRGTISDADVDLLLAGGFRRSGRFVYYTDCPSCRACEATRLDTDRFHWSTSMKRIVKRAERDLVLSWHSPVVDERRVQLYNRHRELRGLGSGDKTTGEDYAAFLIHSCCTTMELEVRRSDQLIGISIMDVGRESVSAVYTYFEPSLARYSLGTLAVLEQIKWAQIHGRRWVYLGLYVDSNPHLNYKARFQPQQRRIGEKWVDIA
ncbi:MAG: arginyltransferase [Planctomycetota bacterium]